MNAVTDAHDLELDAFRHFRHDPVGFGEHVLGIAPWSKYREFLHAIRDHDRVACRAGQKVSKTAGLAVFSLWWVCTRPLGKVIFCLPSDLQGKTGVYAEMLRMREEARYPLGGEPHLDTQSGIVWSPRRRIFGFSADGGGRQTEKFLGHSGEDQAFVLDEAPGIPDTIIRALDGNRAGGGKIVLAGNPTRTHGKFYDAFHTEARSWKGVHIPSTASPNVTGERYVPGLALPSYIAEKRADWGEKSWDFQVKILGEFCAQDEHAFLSLQMVAAAQERWTEEPSSQDLAEPLRLGVDPARGGDDSTVIAVRRGNWVRLVELKKHDNVQVANRVLRLIVEHARPGEYVRAKIDQTNNNGVADVLKRAEFPNGITVGIVELMSQDKSTHPNFVDRRAEVYGSLKEWLPTGALPPSSELQTQLTSIKQDTDARLRIRLESKRDLVARLGRSPDHADALALSTFETAPDTSTTGDGTGWDSSLLGTWGNR